MWSFLEFWRAKTTSFLSLFLVSDASVEFDSVFRSQPSRFTKKHIFQTCNSDTQEDAKKLTRRVITNSESAWTFPPYTWRAFLFVAWFLSLPSVFGFEWVAGEDGRPFRLWPAPLFPEAIRHLSSQRKLSFLLDSWWLGLVPQHRSEPWCHMINIKFYRCVFACEKFDFPLFRAVSWSNKANTSPKLNRIL